MNSKVKRIVVYVTSAVGFAAALIAIYEFIPGPKPTEILLTPQSETIVMSSSTLENNRPIVGDEVVVGERLVTGDTIYVVANHLLFGESSSLKAPKIVIFATRITGGLLDVSSEDATSPGDPGAPGGSIFVAAARLDGTRLDSSGGNGAKGRDGQDGTAPGIDGDCRGFGQWVGATDGGNGADGGNGGKGGKGGTITMLISHMDGFPEPIIAGGHGGARGIGGRGGRGGSGCMGLGGSQDSHSPGSNGADGVPGQTGDVGTLVHRQVHFKDVKRAIKDVDLTAEGSLVDALDNIRNQLERNVEM